MSLLKMAEGIVVIGSRKPRVCIMATLGTVLLAGVVAANPLLPTNNDPTNQIRFRTAVEAEAKRQELIAYIWPDGLPTAVLPAVLENIDFPADLKGIGRPLVARIDKLDAEVSGMDFHSISYLIHPVNRANAGRLAIVHQGHANPSDSLSCGVGDTANCLLQEGYTVIVMQMPVRGWNADRTVKLPGGETATIEKAHEEMFEKLVPPLGGGTVFRFFLEPVVQNINYFLKTTINPQDVVMIGVSGGGWTTHMAAAVDMRIKLSVPVAGSSPLYHRNRDPHSYGDTEQYFAPMYAEDIAADGSGGGVATWLEIYVLGGYGEGRRQIMVTNLHDTCCFSGTFADEFKNIVAQVVACELGNGRWEHVLDSTHREHQISPWAVEEVILPALGGFRPCTFSSAVGEVRVLGKRSRLIGHCRKYRRACYLPTTGIHLSIAEEKTP